ncbi:septum formation initiator family protein [Flammeovirgaceae bacterium SG7u.111]|nr:septum formation initiator family protein [Flammeovirgaceae bacterium SG7u.132]WPO36938.1 septum formation initiator family protein [Flammeovirgaceae bacterium SG7u.111]
MNKEFIKNILTKSRNLYLLTGLAFVVWMLFFDSNNILNQYELNQKFEDLQKQENFYKREITEIKKNMKELNSDPEQLEKFAREKYLFKRRGEDVYLVDESAE